MRSKETRGHLLTRGISSHYLVFSNRARFLEVGYMEILKLRQDLLVPYYWDDEFSAILIINSGVWDTLLGGVDSHNGSS